MFCLLLLLLGERADVKLVSENASQQAQTMQAAAAEAAKAAVAELGREKALVAELKAGLGAAELARDEAVHALVAERQRLAEAAADRGAAAASAAAEAALLKTQLERKEAEVEAALSSAGSKLEAEARTRMEREGAEISVKAKLAALEGEFSCCKAGRLKAEADFAASQERVGELQALLEAKEEPAERRALDPIKMHAAYDKMRCRMAKLSVMIKETTSAAERIQFEDARDRISMDAGALKAKYDRTFGALADAPPVRSNGFLVLGDEPPRAHALHRVPAADGTLVGTPMPLDAFAPGDTFIGESEEKEAGSDMISAVVSDLSRYVKTWVATRDSAPAAAPV